MRRAAAKTLRTAKHTGSKQLVVCLGLIFGLFLMHISTIAARDQQAQGDLDRSVHYQHKRTLELKRGIPFAPLDVAVGKDGIVYVADVASNSILVYGEDGGLLGTWAREPGVVRGEAYCHSFAPLAIEYEDESDTVVVIEGCIGSTLSQMHEGPVTIKYLFEARYNVQGGELSFGQFSSTAPHIDLSLEPDTGKYYWSMKGDSVFGLLDQFQPIHLETNSNDRALRIASLGTGKVAAGNFASGTTEVYVEEAGLIKVLDEKGLEMIAPARGPGGQLWILSMPRQVSAGIAPQLLKYDLGLNLSSVEPLTKGQFSDDSSWPWEIDVSEEGYVAYTSGFDHFEVQRIDPQGTPMAPLIGGGVRNNYIPGIEEGARNKLLSLAMNEDEELLVFDPMSARLTLLDADDARSVELGFIPGGIEIDSSNKHLYVLDDSRRIAQYDSNMLDEPKWRVPCGCGLGAHIAGDSGRLLVTDQSAARVLQFDGTTGSIKATDGFTGTSTIWPEDISMSRAGELLTANQNRMAIELWNTSGDDVVRAWPSGYPVGPMRTSQVVSFQQHRSVAALTVDGLVETYDIDSGVRTSRWLPATVEGEIVQVSDIAMDSTGRIYLADSGNNKIQVFETTEITAAATETPTPSITPTPSSKSCIVIGDKWVWPERVVLGETASVTLTLKAACPSTESFVGADLVLVLDRSSSMTGDKLNAAVEGARQIVSRLNRNENRIGLVLFGEEHGIDVSLNGDVSGLIRKLEQVVPVGYTNLAGAVQEAADHLRQHSRASTLPVILILSDGWGNVNPSGIALDAMAAQIHADGIEVYAVGYGDSINESSLMTLVSSPANLQHDTRGAGTDNTLESIRALLQENQAADILITDEMGATVEFINHSARPGAIEGDRTLYWQRSILPPGGITLTYKILPQQAGTHITNVYANAEYRDADGTNRIFVYPIPEIEVIPPTPTPVPSATPTPVELTQVFLPMAHKNTCRFIDPRVDSVLIIDASQSMTEQDNNGVSKLRHAINAARRFISGSELEDGDDRVAIVSFNSSGSIIQNLTGNRADLLLSLEIITTSPQTRIDLGIDRALLELQRVPRGARRAMILLTDGFANPVDPEEVIRKAKLAKEAEVVVFAIGLGSDIDREQLEQIATSPDTFFHVEVGENLPNIYEQIARTVSCPTERRWPLSLQW